MTSLLDTFVSTRLCVITCIECGLTFGLTDGHIVQLRKSKKSFYCPGCKQSQGWYGPNEVEHERDRLAEELREKTQRLETEKARRVRAEYSANSLKGVVTRTKRRIKSGVCPCCNRTFIALGRHMATKHPGYSKEK